MIGYSRCSVVRLGVPPTTLCPQRLARYNEKLKVVSGEGRACTASDFTLHLHTGQSEALRETNSSSMLIWSSFIGGRDLPCALARMIAGVMIVPLGASSPGDMRTPWRSTSFCGSWRGEVKGGGRTVVPSAAALGEGRAEDMCVSAGERK